LTGGISIFHGSPEIEGTGRGTYVSIGGFHPDYVPPGPKIYVPPRLALTLAKGDHLKVQFQLYAAYTPSSLQFGVLGRLEAQFYGFGIRGELALDMLIGFDGNFSIRVAFSVELLVGSRSVAAVQFSGSLTGFTPTVLSGKAEVKFLFFSLSVSGSLTLHEGGQVEPDGVWISPNAPLRLNQPVVPLNVPIERFGTTRLGTAQSFAIESVTATATMLDTTPTMGEFALGMFLELSQEEMLAMRGFENREAGVEIQTPLTSGGMVTTEAGFEEVLVDPKKRPDAPAPQLTFGIVSVFGTLPESGTAVRIRRERFTLVDDKLVAQGGAKTFFEARALRQPGQLIVPELETVA
jgi:hypothetical protein